MRLQYLTDDGIQYLKGNFETNLPHYIQKDSAFFAKMLKEHDFLQDTGYDFNPFVTNLQVTGDESADDVHNAEVIHRALSNLPYYIAIDEKIWAALLHTYLFDFVCEKRKDFLDETVRDYQNKIYNSFFTYTKHGKRRGTFVNCVASLYWGAEMVYAPDNRDDPYGLLREIAATGYPSTIVIFSSSRILGRRETCIGFLKAIHKLRLAQKWNIDRPAVVSGIKYLNLIAGLSMLDMRSEEEIENMTETFYQGYFQTLEHKDKQ